MCKIEDVLRPTYVKVRMYSDLHIVTDHPRLIMGSWLVTICRSEGVLRPTYVEVRTPSGLGIENWGHPQFYIRRSEESSDLPSDVVIYNWLATPLFLQAAPPGTCVDVYLRGRPLIIWGGAWWGFPRTNFFFSATLWTLFFFSRTPSECFFFIN